MDSEAGRRKLLADAVREEMARRGWKPGDLVTQSGISVGSVSNLLNARVSVSPQNLHRLARCLNWSEMTLNELYYGDITEARQLKIEVLIHRLSQLSEADLDRAVGMLAAAFEEERPGTR